MMLCMFVGAAWAQLPVVSPAPVDGKWAEGTKWYTIKQNNTNSIALSNADANGYLMLNSTSVDGVDGYWCVVGDDENGYQFYNLQAGATQTLGAYGSEQNGRMKMYDLDVTKDGSNTLTKTFDIKKLDGQDGYAFVKNHGSANDWWNSRDGYLAYWNYSLAYAEDCAGSQYTFEEVDVTTLVDGYKTNAKAALDMVSFLDVDDEKAAIDAVATTNCNAFAEIDAIVNGVAQYVAFRNGETNTGSVRYNNYLAAYMPNSKGHGASSFNWEKAIWSLKYSGEGSFYVYNVNEKVYLGNPGSRGELTAVPLVAYTFEKIEGNKVELKCGGQTLHLNNNNGNGAVSEGNALTNHDENDVASRWDVETITQLVASYKAAAIAALDGGITNVCTWLGVDASSLIETAKTAINAIETTDYPTFAAIDAEFNDLAEAIAAKNVVFQNSNKEHANRSEVYLATNMSNNKGRGIKTFNYSAVWNLQLAGPNGFYLYNALNNVYLGKPSDGGTLTATPASAYTFEIIENNKVELKCVGQTLHVSNNAECTLINHDGDESASRWYVTTIDITAEIQELIDANATNYAETPALGQYSKAGYDALVAAKSTAKTVEEVNAAIDAFKKSKNLPVFMITGVKDYVLGKSIYDDGVDAPNFKTTNIYDKTMWWALDIASTEVSVAEKVDIYNVGTGNGFWGESSIKITETNENDGAGIADDGIFLFYLTGGQHPIHYQQSPSTMVAYWSYDANSGSAQKFFYIGNSYDLALLSDELFTAAAELAAVNVPNFSFAAGVNNYNPDTKPAFDDAVAKRAEVLGKLSTAEEIAAAKAQLETAIAGVQLNMPIDGKFYRLRCTASDMKYLQYTQNTNANRFDMISGDDGKTVNATFCYTNGGLVSYVKPLYINHDDNVASMKMEKTTVTFSEATGATGQYFVNVGGRYLFGDGNHSDSGKTPDNSAGYRWWLEEVTTLPVTITAAGYASFYAPVAVEVADGLKAYYVSSVEGESAKLTEIEGTIPANTGVLLAGEEGSYNMSIANAVDAIEGNMLKGSVASEYVTTESYVLSAKNDVVGFYKAAINISTDTTNDGTNDAPAVTYEAWLNNGFKAYLPVVNPAQVLRFNFGGNTTAIESVVAPAFDANAPIYDLSGRRVVNAVKGGLYIQNGKKFIVK